MKSAKIISVVTAILILVAIPIFSASCNSSQSTTTISTSSTTTTTTTTSSTTTQTPSGDQTLANLPDTPASEKRLDVAKVFTGGDLPAFCYLGSYAMLAKYVDNSIDFPGVMANSGLGTSALYIDQINMMINGLFLGGVSNAAVNQGFNYYVSGIEGATLADDFVSANLVNNATEIITIESEEEAFTLLKRIISAGIPVEVHLDLSFIKDTIIDNTSYMAQIYDYTGNTHPDHYMVVTGYDSEYVYLNDPTEPVESMGKDIPAKISEFLSAWENGDNEAIDESARMGPYWMLFLGERGTAKTVDELIVWNRNIADNALEAIRDASVNPNINMMLHCNEMALARLVFGNFLIANGYQEAGDLFIEISGIFAQLDTSSTQSEDLLRIAELQEEAISKM